MGSKQRNTITVIGEGITEKHWLLSLKDAYPYFRKVDYVELEHANNMAELEKEIEKAAKMGYAKIFCMIDMDNKKEGVEYEKRAHFFVRHPLHDYFKSKGGSLDDAIKNANASAVARDKGERNYSYSELGKMIEDIKEILSNNV